jgi:hypothetical protein
MTFDDFAAKLGGHGRRDGGNVYLMPVWSRSQVEDRVGAPDRLDLNSGGAALYYAIETGTALITGDVKDNCFEGAVIVHLKTHFLRRGES